MDNKITEYMSVIPYESQSQTLECINEHVENMKNNETLQLCIINDKDKSFIGRIGIYELKSEIPEIGIWIKKTEQGKGYGFEATNATIEWVFRNLGIKRLLYPVDKRNHNSIKIVKKINSSFLTDIKKEKYNGKEVEVLGYEIHNPDYKKTL